jgi:tRNA A37 methylthiotransferase MiaB
VPADVKRRRLNQLLALQEPIGMERNRAWLDRTVEVLVDTIVPPRSHEHHDADDPVSLASRSRGGSGAGERVHLTGRTRQSKLVHLEGPVSWLGCLVDVRIEHAGPYALRGVPTTGAAATAPRPT